MTTTSTRERTALGSRVTDLVWNPDGTRVVASTVDGAVVAVRSVIP